MKKCYLNSPIPSTKTTVNKHWGRKNKYETKKQ